MSIAMVAFYWKRAVVQTPTDMARTIAGPAAVRVAVSLMALLFTACTPLAPMSRQEALLKAAHAHGVIQVDRSHAKLVTWQEWQDASGQRGGPIPGPSSKQLVWVVAISGRVHVAGSKVPDQPGVVVILDAVSGKIVMETTGPLAWPSYWDRLPDRGP